MFGPNGPPFIISCRFMIAVLVFFAYTIQYMHKVDLSVGIVCMINNTWLSGTSPQQNTSNQINENIENCLFDIKKESESDGPFRWSTDIQGLVLASFFWGYLITEIPGGWLSMRFGSKMVILIGVAVSSVATLLMPIGAKGHYAILIVLRIIAGLAQGVMWPAMASLWTQWTPPGERSKLIGFGNSGSQAGSVIALPLGGYLCVNGFDGGWGSIFYIFGIAGIVWCIAWFILSSDSPATNRFINKNEKDYILRETEEIVSSHNEHESLSVKFFL